MTIFKNLKKKYNLRAVRRTVLPLQFKPLKNKEIIHRFLEYYRTAEKFSWHKQPWYQGTGLHYSKSCDIQPPAAQVCGGGHKNSDYQNTMLFDQPIDQTILKSIEFFPLVRCKITSMLPVDGGNANEKFLWHKDETPHEVLRIIVPLETSNEYQFQLDNYQPICLEVGNIYAFDQSILHRVFKTTDSLVPRTHLILSYVTWFDRIDECWIPNQYAGKVHPLELFDLIKL